MMQTTYLVTDYRAGRNRAVEKAFYDLEIATAYAAEHNLDLWECHDGDPRYLLQRQRRGPK